jgi:APA family basic amino acid/polyamine antiporter
MRRGLFAKKSIHLLLAEAAASKGSFQRTLGPWNLITMGVGAIIGAGFFVLTGQVAAAYTGPGVLISFVIAALICSFAALCYAEFASLIPVAGSAYSYAYATLGELSAWTIGWALILEYLFCAATVAVGWSGYVVSFLRDFGFIFPETLCSAPLAYDSVQGWVASGQIVNLPAMLITALVGCMISIGIQTAAMLNNLMVIIKVGVILLFVGCGVAFIDWHNLLPLIPENRGQFGEFGWSGILRGAGVVFFAFIGFDAVSTLAQEAKKPQRDLPIGMLGSLGLSTLIYIIVATVLVGVVSYTQLQVPDPLAVAVNALGPKFIWLRFVLKLAIVISLSSVVLVMLLAQARVVYVMAADRLLPHSLGKIHPRLQTPFLASLLVTVTAMLISGLFPVGILGQMSVLGGLLAFAIVCLGVLVLRKAQPKLHRPFRCPCVPLVPMVGLIACVVQMFVLQPITWLQLIAWLIVGYIIYFCYSAKQSPVRNE